MNESSNEFLILDRTCRNILKQMAFTESDQATRLYNWYEDIEELAKSINQPVGKTHAAIRFLHELGYIAYGKNKRGVVRCFYLDHKGRMYKHFQRRNLLHALAPTIAVSAIAAMISALLLLRMCAG